MSLRNITILVPPGEDAAIKEIVVDPRIIETWSGTKRKSQPTEVNILVNSKNMQGLVDEIQSKFGREKSWRIIISPVETTIPRQVEPVDEDVDGKKSYGGMTREALYDQILKRATTDQDFVILVILSTIVTAIGLITNNLAVIIGAMVIAPLLGPNLALSFGVTLGDKKMVSQAIKANAVGFSLTIFLSALIGFAIPYENYADSQEYVLRVNVGYEGIVLALASGAAAVLSLTAGISSTMVGVMVAVALMPPAVAIGLAMGSGVYSDAVGAALLLSINVICVNIAAKAVFILKGIRPRTWYMRKKTKQSLKISLAFWGIFLLILIILINIWQYT